MGALNTARKVTFLPEDPPFSEYTGISGRAHAMAGRGEGPAPLNPAAPTGKAGCLFFDIELHELFVYFGD